MLGGDLFVCIVILYIALLFIISIVSEARKEKRIEAEERKRLEEEKRKRLEEERIRLEEEKRKRLEEERKRFEEEKRKRLEEERKRLEEEKRKRLEERERLEEEERKRLDSLKKKLDCIIPNIRKLKYWDCTHGIPNYYFFTYYPKRYENVSELAEQVRKYMYDFKDGRDNQFIKAILLNKLCETFGDTLPLLTFVCIPASTEVSNRIRYKSFMDFICDVTKMSNGFEHITIVKEKEPKHLGGEDTAEYEYDKDFFQGSKIVLFDDIITKGESINNMKVELEKIGAKVVAAFTIGKTYYNRWGNVGKEYHPWFAENPPVLINKNDEGHEGDA